MPELPGFLPRACPHNILGASGGYRLNNQRMAPYCLTAGARVQRRLLAFPSSWPDLKRTPAGMGVKTVLGPVNEQTYE